VIVEKNEIYFVSDFRNTLFHVHINHVWDDLFLYSCEPILLVFGLAEWKKHPLSISFCRKKS
jgi:hypothetical protein